MAGNFFYFYKNEKILPLPVTCILRFEEIPPLDVCDASEMGPRDVLSESQSDELDASLSSK
jgi:hypothetical protein